METENIPNELVVDLEGVDIGQSFKISAIQLPENVHPTIQGRDFVVATLAAPTVIKEPEKPAETEEGAEATGEEGATQVAEGDGKTPPADAAKSEKKDETKKGDYKKSQPDKK